MRKKSHISLAKYIVQDMQIPEMVEHRKAFYLGSILPDCVPSFLTTRHEFDGTFDQLKERIIWQTILHFPTIRFIRGILRTIAIMRRI